MKSIPQGISIIYFNGESKNIYAELPQDREQAKRLSKRLSTVWLAHFFASFPGASYNFGFWLLHCPDLLWKTHNFSLAFHMNAFYRKQYHFGHMPFRSFLFEDSLSGAYSFSSRFFCHAHRPPLLTPDYPEIFFVQKTGFWPCLFWYEVKFWRTPAGRASGLWAATLCRGEEGTAAFPRFFRHRRKQIL